MITNGKVVRIAYELTVDGKVLKSVQTERPYCFVCGRQKRKEIPEALEAAIHGLKAGNCKSIDIPPKKAHGNENPHCFIEVPKARYPKTCHAIGKEISARDGKYLARVKEVRKNTLLLNFNHPLAGKTLHYEVFVVSVDGIGAPSEAKWPTISGTTKKESKKPKKRGVKKKG